MGLSATLNMHERQQCSIGVMLVGLHIAPGISANLLLMINVLSSATEGLEPITHESDMALLVTASS